MINNSKNYSINNQIFGKQRCQNLKSECNRTLINSINIGMIGLGTGTTGIGTTGIGTTGIGRGSTGNNKTVFHGLPI
jgi:hypothetical protein